MDKQTDIRTNTQNMIPVNTRTIGTPEGIYILYLEDYEHTFLGISDRKNTPAEDRTLRQIDRGKRQIPDRGILGGSLRRQQ